ncbi:SRPBCC family protein [Bradyrhizobium elkanii]|uniref:SRPBCC family protein n=1 Tax=Bradyrhizobium elkanii TaxID=29448 RepID=UPI00040FC8C9|nr:SRPBCC domain-containing protein [Bradyrhizobium elkanii]
MQWFGPANVKPGSVQAELDVRAGGRYRISFTGNDGEYHQVGGVYREVVPNERLVFTWAWHSTPERESLVTVSLRSDGAGTLLTFHHEQFVDETARDDHERGWSESLGKLEKFVTSTLS